MVVSDSVTLCLQTSLALANFIIIIAYCVVFSVVDKSEDDRVHPKTGSQYVLRNVHVAEDLKRTYRVSSVALVAPPQPAMSNSLITDLKVNGCCTFVLCACESWVCFVYINLRCSNERFIAVMMYAQVLFYGPGHLALGVSGVIDVPIAPTIVISLDPYDLSIGKQCDRTGMDSMWVCKLYVHVCC